MPAPEGGSDALHADLLSFSKIGSIDEELIRCRRAYAD